jgi:hypothetical protein
MKEPPKYLKPREYANLMGIGYRTAIARFKGGAPVVASPQRVRRTISPDRALSPEGVLPVGSLLVNDQ